MIGNVALDRIMKKKYTEKQEELPFELISFKNVLFKHSENRKYVFNNYSKELYINDKIIGITGLSGNGKYHL
jgi:ABC-type bacteriocin/lantibiotic exporter with double-glycine peptidase domain